MNNEGAMIHTKKKKTTMRVPTKENTAFSGKAREVSPSNSNEYINNT